MYDSTQDSDKPLGQKVKERVLNVVGKVLKNRQREQVATVVPISGPLQNPKTGTLETVLGLVENAFIKAILPGFEAESAKWSGDVDDDAAGARQQTDEPDRARTHASLSTHATAATPTMTVTVATSRSSEPPHDREQESAAHRQHEDERQQADRQRQRAEEERREHENDRVGASKVRLSESLETSGRFAR